MSVELVAFAICQGALYHRLVSHEELRPGGYGVCLAACERSGKSGALIDIREANSVGMRACPTCFPDRGEVDWRILATFSALMAFIVFAGWIAWLFQDDLAGVGCQ